MATWKKLLVSGSNISQLNNDSGYLSSAGSGLVSSSAQIDHDQTTNYNANEHFTQANITTVGTVTTGDVSAILPTGTVSGSIQVDGANITNNTISFGGVSVALNSSDATPAFDLSDATAYPGDSSLVTLGTVTTGDVSAILPSGVVSGSSLSSPNQGTVTLTTNGVAASAVDLGLQTGDSPQFTNLTLTGNLTVQGDTINANVTNLDIEDRYILLNSGSSTIGDSGIVFGGANGTAQQGAAVIWDASYNSNDGRLAVVNDMASNATGDQTPNYHVAGVFEGTEGNAATAQADHVGNIRVESEEIFIYV